VALRKVRWVEEVCSVEAWARVLAPVLQRTLEGRELPVEVCSPLGEAELQERWLALL
jgi:hypothetical protein